MNFDLDISLDEQLLQLLAVPNAQKPIIVFPEASDPRIIAAASALLNFAKVLLLGEKDEIRALCDYKSVELCCSRNRFFERVTIIDPSESLVIDELAEALVDASKGRKWELDLDAARERVVHPVYFGAMLVRKGYVDACLGGVAYSTKDFLAPCLRLIKSTGTAFEMGLFALPQEEKPLWDKNIVMFSDVALNVQPNSEQLANIAVESCKTLRDIIPTSVLPEVHGALISYSTKGSGAGPSVEVIREAEKLVEEKLKQLQQQDESYSSISITGELQISVAVSKDAAKVKLKDRMDEFKAAGRANVLIVPSLDEGNMLYHLFNTQYPTAKSSLIMGGMNGQVLDYSRGSSITQIIRGAKLLLLTRLKSTKPLAVRSPLFPSPRILVLNPGGVSTQVALFEGDSTLFNTIVEHNANGVSEADLDTQLNVRMNDVRNILEKQGVTIDSLDLVSARGGMLTNPDPGSYLVTEHLLGALKYEPIGRHPSNLGAFMAWELSKQGKITAIVSDCPTINELSELNRVTGLKDIEKTPVWHALSQRQVGRMYADSLNVEYKDLNLIIAHLGSGISIGSHAYGRCINVNNALYDGPIGTTRAGTLPTEVTVELCYAGIEKDEVKKILSGHGGLNSYFGTHDMRKVEELAGMDEDSDVYVEALAKSISSEILSRLADFFPEKPDQILLTGRLCLSRFLLEKILAQLALHNVGVTVYPGSFEAEALRDSALSVSRDVEIPKTWLSTELPN